MTYWISLANTVHVYEVTPLLYVTSGFTCLRNRGEAEGVFLFFFFSIRSFVEGMKMWKIVFLFLATLFAGGLGGMVGGRQDIDVDDEGVRNALNFAVAEHNKASNDLFYVKDMELLKAQSQVSNV